MTCHATYWIHTPSLKLISQSMLTKSPENADGWRDGHTDGQTDGHCHSIIHPFFKWAHNKIWSLPNHKITTMWEPSTTTYEMDVLIRYQLTPINCSLGWITSYYHWTLRLTSVPSLSTWTKSSHKLLNWKLKLLGFPDIILLKIWLHKWWEVCDLIPQ